MMEDLLNDFDNILVSYASVLRRFFLRWKNTDYPGPGISKQACSRGLIMLSDQQLVTGTAILVVSFAKHKSMTQYHFEIACTLAWMAYAVHDTIIVAALDHIRAHPEMRWWRALWISILFPMLFVSQLVTFHDKFLYVWGNSIQYIWDDMESGYPRVSLFLLVVLVLMVHGYINTMYSLYPEYLMWVGVVGSYVSCALRSPGILYLIVKSKYEASPRSQKPLWLALKATTFFLFIIFFSIYQIVDSTLFSTVRLYIVLIWGTMYLVELKGRAPREGLQGSENEWGFGQILPIVLLALTFFGIGEVYHRDFSNAKSMSDDSFQEGEVARSDTLPEEGTKKDPLTLLEKSLLGFALYRLFLVVSAAAMLAGFTKLAVVDGYVV
ncbi:hypothetical protein P170DRAFT_267913 [Aspergillus steynii IBT 23096]|uniref:Uncharacterized protein n=1 Tax=Aspergillus steynii IBT 23096 TaxID=1392250 RepID=A0A2I2FW97_9EURO|nr:uncharacterized protein P170DRAFT_267913 [Aspergillus steynii IBT 23096]PLB44836.1 hypothetical protein P170DRAFT_267913 [Aspergillus steynii IBT 23096]